MKYHPQHQDPDEYDLPIGDWMCRACAAKALSVGYKRMHELATEFGIEHARARPFDRRVQATFFIRTDVEAARKKRAQEPVAGSVHELRAADLANGNHSYGEAMVTGGWSYLAGVRFNGGQARGNNP